MAKRDVLIRITAQNQFNWSKRARLYREKGQLQGAELLSAGQIPLGTLLTIEQHGLGDMKLVVPVEDRVPCPHCRETGVYVRRLEHGTFRGRCWTCFGKGYTTAADRERNETYHRLNPKTTSPERETEA